VIDVTDVEVRAAGDDVVRAPPQRFIGFQPSSAFVGKSIH
jgi:hypothetical protein